MKLILKNVGKLKDAEINIDGITVIAGKNNTGKSTVGKSLYCIFNSLYNVNQKIEDDRKEYIKREIEILFIKNSLVTSRSLFKHAYKDIIENISNDIIDKKNNEAKETILFVFNQLNEKRRKINNLNNEPINDENLNEFFKNIQESLNISDDKFYINRLNNIIYKEFNGQINNINNKLVSTINLVIKENLFKIDINREKIKISKYKELESDIVYIDNPFVLDNIDSADCDNIISNHRCNTITKLRNNMQDDNMTANILLQDKIGLILNKLDDIGVGSLVQEKTVISNRFKYKSKFDNEPLELVNVSAGLKTFIILKTLILNGHIKDKGCIVLDEPEIHLHPEWQLVFAELIVLLQKTFNLHILLNTHSPYFLRAIQVYSTKHETSDRCNYYLAENIADNMADIRNVNGNTNEIYKLLYHPFQQLDDEPYYDN